ncbi:MAG: tetratricopeptide repeat protein [Dysgonamonadaceae bacterium]|jgi:hypothetical protein|nr:tetratricopeptide repeat protein [Dysgonamonadaceae bacterium]
MKNTKIYRFVCQLILVVLISVFSSCKTTHNFAIEIREPAKITFPADVAKVVVINNAAAPETGDFGAEYYFNNKEISAPSTINFDSAIWVSVSALAKGIYDEKFFSETMAYLEPVRTDNANMEIQPIPKDIKQTIYDTTDADAIISIDRCLFRYSQKVNQPAVGYYTFVNTKTDVNITYSVYLRDREKPLTSFSLQDSLLFSSQIIGDSAFLYDILPNTLIEEMAAYIGEKVVPYFTPSWKGVERNLYTSLEARMKESLAYAKANKWTAAKEIWLQLYDKKNNSTEQARLANNIAVAFEIQDDLHKALEWAQKAEMLFKKDNAAKNQKEMNLITIYISSLTERINNDSLLNMQFGVE